jgi:hypothetical protein
LGGAKHSRVFGLAMKFQCLATTAFLSSRVLLDMLIFAKMIKKFSSVYETQGLIAPLTKACHLALT